jgi:glycosyltransferase involved in cell wall biosynthesis
VKILLVTPMPPSAHAPAAIPLVLHAQLVGLLGRHEVTLITVVGAEAGEHDSIKELPQQGVDVHVVEQERPRGAARWQRRFRLAGTWARGRYPWRTVWFADPRIQNVIDRLTSSRTFDVAAIEDNSMGVLELPPHLPTVLTEHEVRRPRALDWHAGSPKVWPSWAFRELDWRRWPAYQRSVWRRFDLVQVFTERDARTLAELAPDVFPRVRVNPFGIDLPTCADPNREEPNTLLFAGNFAHPPNVDAVLWLAREVMPRLWALRPDARLTIIGAYPPGEVRELAGPDIDVLGRVDRIEPFQERTAVVIAPVRTGGGMRMKVLQSLALGKAVVTTPRGADGLAIGGREPPLVLGEDADAIAGATARLLADRTARRALGSRARDFVAKHYSAEAYASRLEDTYAEVISQHSSRDRICPDGVAQPADRIREAQ